MGGGRPSRPLFTFNQYWFGKLAFNNTGLGNLANIHCSNSCPPNDRMLFRWRLTKIDQSHFTLLEYHLRLCLFFNAVSEIVLFFGVDPGSRSIEDKGQMIPWFLSLPSLPSANPDNTQWNLLAFKWGGEKLVWVQILIELLLPTLISRDVQKGSKRSW